MKIKNILEDEIYTHLIKKSIINICTILAECEDKNNDAKLNSSIVIIKLNSIQSASLRYTKPISKCL